MAWIQLATWRYLGAVGLGQNPDTKEWYAISALNSGGYDDLTYNTNEEATWDDSEWKHLIKFALEYDSGSLTATSIKLRIRTLDTSTSDWDTDYYYAYIGPQSNSKGTVVKVKDHGDTGTSAFGQPTGDTFTITKERTATYFTIPEIWLMHTGGVAVATTNGVHTLTYDSAVGAVNVYTMFNSGNRKNFRTIIPGFNQSSKSGVITIPVILDNSAGGAITITDNKDNTVTITVPEFVVGDGNGISPPGSSTDFNNNYVYIEFFDSSGKSLKVILKNTFGTYPAISIPEGAVKVKVWAKAISNYGDDVKKDPYPTERSINYYKAPSWSTDAKIWYESNGEVSTDSKYDADNPLRPRLNKELAFRWSGAVAGNSETYNKIVGYRVIIYLNSEIAGGADKGGTALILDIEDLPDNMETTTTAKETPCHDWTVSTNPYFEFIPKTTTFIKTDGTEYTFKKDDICRCKVSPYSKNGVDTKLVADDPLVTWCKFKNSAVIYLKTDEGWKEGIPYVKTSSGWKEAEGVYVKTDANTWTEST